MSQGSASHPIRVLLLVVTGACAASLTPSCLTPDAKFDQSTDEGEGGSGPIESDHCDNRSRDSDETDIDCGGLDCSPCSKGKSCSVDSDCANEECTNEICQAASCTDKVQNANETDVDCGGEDCSPCPDGDACKDDQDCESAVCKGGSCAEPTCTDRVKNGVESDVDCGGPDCNLCDSGEACMRTSDCAQPPVGDIAVSLCEDDVCQITCPVGLEDCNNQVADGCETSLNGDVNNCGGCGDVCDPEHTTAAKCVAGECLIDKEAEGGGCSGNWLDCNGEPADGCEVNSNSDPDNCGGCGSDFQCSDNNGTPSCKAKVCTITCNDDFKDCDGDALSNGCETNTGNNVAFCGGCDDKCLEGNVNESPNCVNGVCGVSPCAPGTGDCDGDESCTDMLNTLANCGACGNSCSATNATTACVDQGSGAFECEIDTCVDDGGADFENCDGLYETGCKTDVNVNPEHCGTCGNDCGALASDPDLEIAAIGCNSGGCEVNGCKSTFLDCDDSATNGCEVDSSKDPVRCGGCLDSDPNPGAGISCSAKDNATPSCNGSSCNWTCDSGFGDVDGDLLEEDSNGCETSIPPCEAAYVSGTFYSVGAKVSDGGKNWECNRAECRVKGCAPGVSCPWGQTWTDLGLCD